MSAITISRQLGSLGTQIARRVADNLGYRVVGRQIINEAAARSATPEVALSMIDDLGLFQLKPSYRQRKAYQKSVEQVLHELVHEGNVVIVGRASQVVLKDQPNVLHVRIVAPLPVRVERLTARDNISAEAARARICESDRSRRDYLRRYYGVDWNDPELYDLVLNTARITLASGASLIVRALTQPS